MLKQTTQPIVKTLYFCRHFGLQLVLLSTRNHYITELCNFFAKGNKQKEGRRGFPINIWEL